MRVAIAASLALTTAFGLSTPAFACPVESGVGGMVSNAIAAVGNLLGLTSGTVASAPPTTTPAAPANAAAASNAVSPTTPAAADGTPPSFASVAGGGATSAGANGRGNAGAGGGGGGIGFASGGQGSTISSNAPHNPSADMTLDASFATDGARDGIAPDAASTGQVPEVGSFRAAANGDSVPVSPIKGVALASLTPDTPAIPDPWPVGMTAATTESDPVSFEREGTPSEMSRAFRFGGLLAGVLIGIGLIGSGWARRSFGAAPGGDGGAGPAAS